MVESGAAAPSALDEVLARTAPRAWCCCMFGNGAEGSAAFSYGVMFSVWRRGGAWVVDGALSPKPGGGE